MVIFAILLHCTFPISEFMGGIPDRRVMSNMKDLFAVKDLFEGFEHNFKPEYVCVCLSILYEWSGVGLIISIHKNRPISPSHFIYPHISISPYPPYQIQRLRPAAAAARSTRDGEAAHVLRGGQQRGHGDDGALQGQEPETDI